MKKRDTFTSLVLSMLSIVLSMAMLAGTTFAWFTVSVTSGNNIIVSGNLHVMLEYSHTGEGDDWKTVTEKTNVFCDNPDATDENGKGQWVWEPGCTRVVYLRVRNTGSMALKYQLGIRTVGEEYGKTDSGKEIKLSENIKFGGVAIDITSFKPFSKDDAGRKAARAAVEESAKTISEGKPFNGEYLPNGKSPSEIIALVVYMPEDVGADANPSPDLKDQPKLYLGITLVATQIQSEADSFGTDYDASSDYPAHPGTIQTTLSAQVEDPANEIVLAGANVKATIPGGALGKEVGSVTLSVKTTELTANSVTYEINLLSSENKPVQSKEQITLELEVGKGLKHVSVNHSGKPMDSNDYRYNPETGLLTIKTKSFSPFTVMYSEFATYDVTPENIQEYLSGQHGSLTYAKLILAPGDYGKLLIGLPSKYAGGDTVYTCLNGDNHSNVPMSFTDASEFIEHLSTSTWHTTPNYLRTIDNLTIVGQEGVTVDGLLISSGHAHGGGSNVFDPVLGKEVSSAGYYMTQNITNLTFKDITFTAKCDIATSAEKTVIDGVTYDGCTFTTGGTASSNGQALRYYNENKNGNVRNLTVKNCSFNNCYQGVYTQNINGVTVTNCEFKTTGHNAIAVQSGGVVDHKKVVIENNTFADINDRIIRFNEIGTDTQITIKNNTATNSGDDKHEVIKATSFGDGVTFDISGNNWGENAIVANEQFKDAP